MSRIRITDLAKEDLAKARRWYLQEAPHMEAALEEELVSAFQRIDERPQLYQRVEGEARRTVLTRFPFSIYYRELDEWIEIIAVVHQARDPRIWKSRLDSR